jgi:hypothetical protein
MKNIVTVIRLSALASAFTFGGAGLFAAPVEAPKHIYRPDGYSIVTIDTPKDVRLHATGLDAGPNGQIMVATRFGEVWQLVGNTWKKFAEGLHEPTGLLIDDDGSILVAHKPELTRLIDTNDDGIADEYINVADDWKFHDNYHEYTFGPVKNAQGDYIGTLNLSHGDPGAFKLGAMGSSGGYRGFAYKVSKDGEFSPYAWGLRSPAGIGSSPTGEVFFTDNQGDWVPTSTIHFLQEGRFYGHPVSLHEVPGFSKAKLNNMSASDFDAIREKPVAYIPHVEVGNSPGNPAWDISKGRFGPFAGQIFVGDQTQSNIFRVLLDRVNGQYQGAVINFMNGFQSGNIRNMFDQQGQLWVGQTARGWEAAGPKLFGLQKVVWDGTTPFELLSINLTETGFRLTFTEDLDPKSVALTNFSAAQWGYKYSSAYGSPKVGLAALTPTQVKLLNDKRTILLDLPLQTDKVLQINFSQLRDKNGRSTSVDKVYYTLNQLLKADE